MAGHVSSDWVSDCRYMTGEDEVAMKLYERPKVASLHVNLGYAENLTWGMLTVPSAAQRVLVYILCRVHTTISIY